MFDLLRGSGIVWQAAASLDVARDPRYLDEAYVAGCRSLFVGFESLSPENMRGNNKPVNAATNYAEVCRRFHDAGIMINGSFVFGFDCDGPDVFERTVEFAVENKILTASFHILTPLPGTRTFERMAGEGRLLHRDWSRYDTYHAVFQPSRMTPEQLEAGYQRARRGFASWSSIMHRSLGLPGVLKRIAYNAAWMKIDPLWVAIIRAGMMPFATRIFERVLQLGTRERSHESRAVPRSAGVNAASVGWDKSAQSHHGIDGVTIDETALPSRNWDLPPEALRILFDEPQTICPVDEKEIARRACDRTAQGCRSERLPWVSSGNTQQNPNGVS